MGTLRTIAVVVLSISFVVFIAFFGRLPVFKHTPIGFLNRMIWKHIPHAMGEVDQVVTGRRLSRGLSRTGHYLMNEAHPLVMIFFFLLLAISEVLYVPPAWARISSIQHIVMPTLIALPYMFLYLSNQTSSNITHDNHQAAMHAYPYDHVLFHPGYFCSTCKMAKPPRSKHCGICKACIQKHDHHCVWVNNCVGRNNYIWFNLLLLSVSILLLYGAFIGYSILNGILQDRFVPPALVRGSSTAKRWSTKLDWTQWLDCWAWAIATHWRIGAVTLLCTMSCPLSTGLFVYHVYLVWAGMTTNEQDKWSDWREDIAYGDAYKALISELRQEYPPLPSEVEPRDVPWPVKEKWWMIRTRNGEKPTRKVKKNTDQTDGTVEETEEIDERWVVVKSLAEVENIYDLGFSDNLKDIFVNRE